MNYKEKLEKIMDVLDIEDYEITRAIENKENYENLDGRKVDSFAASETFWPIHEECIKIFKTPFNGSVTNTTDGNALSPRAPSRGV